MSTPGMRVDAAALPGISRRSGVQIVTGTGLYIARSRPERWREATIDSLTDWMVSEIEEGIDDTGVRAGQIGEIGIEKLDDGDRRLLRAAVRAAERTGVSISIHPGFEDGCDGRAIADVLEDEGCRPERVVIGHGDAFLSEHSFARLVDDPGSWTLRLDYHRELLARGYNLSIDCFGHDWGREDDGWVIETDWQRMAGLVALLREGHADQLAIGCDVFTRSLHRRGGGFGYRYLLDWVLPRLRERGIDEATIEKLTVANPARILSRETGSDRAASRHARQRRRRRDRRWRRRRGDRPRARSPRRLGRPARARLADRCAGLEPRHRPDLLPRGLSGSRVTCRWGCGRWRSGGCSRPPRRIEPFLDLPRGALRGGAAIEPFAAVVRRRQGRVRAARRRARSSAASRSPARPPTRSCCSPRRG